MIEGSKSMIAACIEKMRRDGCGGCAKRDACAELMRRFGVGRAEPPARRERGGTASPFLSILAEFAARISQSAEPAVSAFRRSVDKEIESLLPGGQARMDAVARAVGCSRQTLYRRLREEGVTYEALVEGVRRRLALRLLRDRTVSVKEAGYRLGFAEPAAFSRAFKRWTGKSPAAWRAGYASG